MSLNRSIEPATPARGRRPDLGEHYGRIGIGAVRAALRYAGEGKNQAYAPVDPDVSADNIRDREAA